jgi:hypothetical protein
MSDNEEEVKETETTDSATTTVIGEPAEQPPEPEPELAIKKDTDAILDATKELTKVVGELAKKLNTHMTAGKF